MELESYLDSEAMSEYLAALQGLLNKSTEIAEWKITRSLEEAKILSVNSTFQKAIAEIRSRWSITPELRDDIYDPWAVLYHYTSHLNEAGRTKLNQDLQTLAKQFGLDFAGEDERDDFGLIVASLCFGLTPDILLNYWDKIKHTVAQTRSPGIRPIADTNERLKQHVIQMAVIAYLFLKLWKAGLRIELPEPVREVIEAALKQVGKIETAEQAVKIIQKIQEAKLPIDLFLKIERSTTLEDIKRTWPQIELRKAEFLKREEKSKPTKRKRVWRTYARDIFVWRRVNQDGLTYQRAYDEWLKKNPEEEPVEITAVIKSVNRIDEVPREN